MAEPLHYLSYVVQNKGDFMNNSLKRSEYETMYLGKWVAQCAVHDNKGQHCPDESVHYVEYRGEKVGLCERCFLNFQNGAFEQERVKRINREDRLYIRTTGKVQNQSGHSTKRTGFVHLP